MPAPSAASLQQAAVASHGALRRLHSVASVCISSFHAPPCQAFVDSQRARAWVRYDGQQKQVQVFVRSDGGLSRPATPQLVAPLDLAEVLGTSSVYVGATAGGGPCCTFDSYTLHDMSAWRGEHGEG